MTTPTPTPAPTGPVRFDPVIAFGRPEVAAALDDHDQALQLLAALEEAVRDGDPGVKPSELRDARDLVDHARLRVEAAQRAAERRERDERAAAYKALGERARSADVVPDEQIVQAFTDALTSLDRLAQLAGKRSDAIRVMARDAVHLVKVADDHGEREVLRAAGVHNASTPGIGGGARLILVPPGQPTQHLTDLAPQDALMAALARIHACSSVPLEFTDREPSSALADASRVFPTLADAEPAREDDNLTRPQ